MNREYAKALSEGNVTVLYREGLGVLLGVEIFVQVVAHAYPRVLNQMEISASYHLIVYKQHVILEFALRLMAIRVYHQLDVQI